MKATVKRRKNQEWADLLHEVVYSVHTATDEVFKEAGRALGICSRKLNRAIARFRQFGAIPAFVKKFLRMPWKWGRCAFA